MNIDEFLERYPWNPEDLERAIPVETFWEFELDVEATELWPYLVDTSRFNRALGLGKMDYEEREGRLHGQTVNAGFQQVWVEDPWQWIEGRTIIGGRRYSKGFGLYVRVIYELSASEVGSGVCLRVYFGWLPRNWLGKTFLKLGMPWLQKRYTKVLSDLCHGIREGRPKVFQKRLENLDPSVEARLQDFRVQMIERELPDAAVTALLDFVRTADEMDAYRLRVPAFSLETGIDDEALLTTCLHATRLGLLRMSWDLICPHCRGVRTESFALNEVSANGICDSCQIEFASDVENALEITFQIHSSIRNIPKVFYCAAEPAGKRHIKLQQHLDAGASRLMQPLLETGRYRLRVLGREEHCFLDVVANLEPDTVEWDGRMDALDSKPEESQPGLRCGRGASFLFKNNSESEHTYIVEDIGWSDMALRPARLFSCHEFRDLFGEEFLDAGVGLSVGNQTLLFTDVVESTRFYRESGDPKAYAEIRAHFEEIFEVVAKNRGAIVKTIGDAVMAAFSDPLDALKVSQELQKAFHPQRSDLSIRLRVSLNMGPCIAVNLNTSIDYFGSAVNLAAKLQSLAAEGDIVFSDSVWQVPEVQEYFEGQQQELEALSFENAAFDAPIPAFRWQISQ